MRTRPWRVYAARYAVVLSAVLGVPAVVLGQAGIKPPVVVQRVDAVYPKGAAGAEGDVVVAISLDATGKITSAKVSRSGGALFDEAALAAVRQWVFQPTLRDGVPVPAVGLPISFHFAPPAPPPVPVASASAAPPRASASAAAPPASAVASVAASGPALAPSASASAAPTEVTIQGQMQARSHGASDYRIDVGALAAVPRGNASDLLKLAPGILLTNEGGEGHAEQVFLRGFDAREGQDLEFTVDGVPINDAGNLHGNGYADTHFILPELVESLRVVEGPYAPQQGNFAVAGSADYQLGLAQRGLTTKYTTGSYNTQRLLLLWGPEGGSTHTFAGAEYYTTDGFGQNRQAKRASAIGQYEGRIGETGIFRVTVTAYDTEYNTAGVMREDDYDSGRKGFYDTEDPNQSGDTASRYSIALTYDNTWGPTQFQQKLFVISRTMRLRENFTGFLEDVQYPIQSLHPQRGDLIDLSYQGLTIGARGSARYRTTLDGLVQELELGYYARADQTTSSQNRIQAANDAPYKTDADLTSTLGDIGLYADANVHLAKWLALRGGVRADMFLFDVLNNCAVQNTVDFPSRSNPPGDASCLDQQEHGAYREPFQRNSTGSGAIMPRGTLLLGPFNDFQMSVSYGKGVRSIDPIYVTQALDTPFVSVQSYEGGVAYAHAFEDVALTARSVFFSTHVDRDLIFDETEGRNTLSNGSTRTGWAGSFRATGTFFDEAANLTAVKATFDDTHLLVPYVPDLVLRSDTALFHDLPGTLLGKPVRGVLGYGVSFVGRRPLPYGQLSDTIFVSDASLSLKWSAFQASLVTTNLFGVMYRLGEYNYVSDFHTAAAPTLVPTRMYTAGAPREIFLSLAATLGGE